MTSSELIGELVATPWLLDRLEVSTVRLDQVWSTTATLALVDQRRPDHRVGVVLEGIRDLRFAQTSSNMALVLQIVDIADRGWEGVRYAVTDHENGTISLYCREITAVEADSDRP
jgi:hypothetical protein